MEALLKMMGINPDDLAQQFNAVAQTFVAQIKTEFGALHAKLDAQSAEIAALRETLAEREK